MSTLPYETGASMARLRRDEGVAFARLGEALDGAAVPSVRATRAAHTLRRVWSALIADLGSQANGLPPDLRARLIGIGLATIRDTDALLSGEREAAGRLAETCRTLSRGLLAPPAPVPTRVTEAS